MDSLPEMLSMLLDGAVDVLDISEDLREAAVTAYEEVGAWLADHGNPGSQVYPQGSFLLGTVVRPATQGASTTSTWSSGSCWPGKASPRTNSRNESASSSTTTASGNPTRGTPTGHIALNPGAAAGPWGIRAFTWTSCRSFQTTSTRRPASC